MLGVKSCGCAAHGNHTICLAMQRMQHMRHTMPQAMLLRRCFTPAEQAWPAAHLLSGTVWAGWPCSLPAQCGSPTAVGQMLR